MARNVTRFSVFLLTVSIASAAHAAVPAQTDVVIIGAGLSGLTAAYGLKQAGIKYHVLELTPRVGGRVRTARYKQAKGPDLYADSGMEEYWESNPAVKVLKELKLPLQVDDAVSSLMIDGKLYEYRRGETSETYLKRIFTAEEYRELEEFKARAAPMISQLRTDGSIPAELMKLKDVSFKDWLEKQGLPKKAVEWVRISVECEVGTHWNRFSALDGLAEFHIFLGKGERSYRVLGGNEKFTDALARAVGSGNVTTNQRVTRVVTRGEHVEVTYLDQKTHQSAVVRARHVVTTIPLFRLLFEVQFDPPLSDKKRQAIMTQGWGSYFKAHVFVPKKAMDVWKHEGESYLPILSDSELGVIYDGNPNQDTDTHIVSLLVSGDAAERFNLMSLDDVRAQITAGFQKRWPALAKDIQGMEFYRYHPRAIAGWPVGRSRFDELSQEIRRPEHGVYLAGDFTENTHSSGAVLSALRVVQQIKGNRVRPSRALSSKGQ